MNVLQKLFQSTKTAPTAPPAAEPLTADPCPALEVRIQQVLDAYRPTLYVDGGDVELLRVDEAGIAHIKMLGACIDCPISILTMKLGIQRLLKENFPEISGVNAITDVDISALYQRQPPPSSAIDLV
ncbi:MAG: NifU family protein [Caldilineaceae bacterium]